MLINNKLAMLCQSTSEFYFGKKEHFPMGMLNSSKCISLVYPGIRSQFYYQKDYKLATPNIIYSILHEINDYKVLTLKLEKLSGNDQLSRIVIANRASIKEYISTFTDFGCCIHTMIDMWQAILVAIRKLLKNVKSASVIIFTGQTYYLCYFSQDNLYLHTSGDLEDVLAEFGQFKKDFLDISLDIWAVGNISNSVKKALLDYGFNLRITDELLSFSFERLCCFGAYEYLKNKRVYN